MSLGHCCRFFGFIRTLGEAVELRKALADASRLFSTQASEIDTQPLRVLWDMIASAGAGATIAKVSGGSAVIGAVGGVINQVAHCAPTLVRQFGPALFGRGAFDLARKVRRGAARIEIEALPSLLSEPERKTLGLA